MPALKNQWVLLGLIWLPLLVHAQQNAPQLGKNSVQEVVAAMTLEEKVSILVGGGMNVPGMPMMGGGEPTDAQKRARFELGHNIGKKSGGCAGQGSKRIWH